MLEDFDVPNTIQPLRFFQSGRRWRRWPAVRSFFVANVNVNGRKLKVNVNHFSNDNVWNAKYGNHVVRPLLAVSPVHHLPGGSFLLEAVPPPAEHPANLVQEFR